MTTLTLPAAFRAASVTFALEGHTTIQESPLTRSTQALARPGARWQMESALPPLKGRDAGEMQAFLTRLRGAAGVFYGYDPSRPEPLGSAGGVTYSHTVTLPAVTGTPLAPSTGLAPSASLAPGSGTYSPATVTVSYSYGPATITAGAVSRGDSAATVAITRTETYSLTGWDYADGDRPGLSAAVLDAANRVDAEYVSQVLSRGDYIQLGSEYKMLTQDMPVTATALAFEPPMRGSSPAGALNWQTPRCRMRLVDDSQAQWSARPGILFSMSISAVEVF